MNAAEWYNLGKFYKYKLKFRKLSAANDDHGNKKTAIQD